MDVGFVGLGTMGLPMAQHIMQRGHSLGVYARRADVTATLVAGGAAGYLTPSALAARSDVVVTMVTGTADVEQVLFGTGGVVEGARRGLLVVDMSTIAPAAAREFAARLGAHGVDMLDAPVSGGPMGARDATLSIMVGGPAEVVERARPLFECVGSKIWHMGEHGAGQITKACQQLLLAVTAEGTAEALTLAQRCGVDPALVQQAMMSSMASSRVLDVFGGRMVARQFESGIPVRLYRKDLGIVLELAKSVGVAVAAGAATMEHVATLVERGQANEDLSALVTAIESTLPSTTSRP